MERRSAKLVIISTFHALLLGCVSALAANPTGFSSDMWPRIRAVEPRTADLTPTPSPAAPAKLSLRECVALALRHNADFRDTTEQLVNARRALWVADQRLFYTVEGSAERDKEPGDTAQTSLSSDLAARWESVGGGALEATVGTGTQPTFNDLITQRPAVTLTYDQPLLRGAGLASSTFERIRSARIALATEDLLYYDAHQDLAQTVIEDYFAVLLARGEIEIARRAVDRAKKLYDINYSKFSGEGLQQPGEQWISQVPEIDVDQARLSWEQAKHDLISAQQDYRDATDELLLAMGLVPGATPELTTAIVYTPQDYDEQALIPVAVGNSTKLGRLELRRADAEAALRVARSAGRPDLIASVGLNDVGDTLGGTSVSAGWFGALRVELPLGERSRREDIDGAYRDLQVLEQTITATRDSVTQQLQSRVREAVSSRERIGISEQSLALARKNRDAAQGMYDEGLSDYLRVLDAEDKLVEAERSLLQEQVAYFLTTVEVRRALGDDITRGLPE